MSVSDPLDWKLLFNRIPVPAWIYEIESLRFLAVNEAALEHYGYALEDMLAMTVLDIRPPADRERFLRIVQRQPHGRAHAGQWQHVRAGGDTIEVDISSHDIAFNGAPARLVVVHDVTARSDSENRARDRVQALRRVLMELPDGLVVVGAEGLVRTANQRAAELLGQDAHAMEGAPLLQLTTTLPGRPFTSRSADGEERVLVAHASSTEWGGEKAVAFLLREVEGTSPRPACDDLIADALEAADTGVMVCEVRGEEVCLVQVNEAFERLTGYAAREVLGRNPRFLQGGATRQAGIDTIRDSLRTGRACQVTLLNERADGRQFWVDLKLAPIRDAAGAITHWVGLQHDMGERRREEAALVYAARHDPITDLPWSGAQREDLLALMAEAHSGDSRVAVLHIDIDRFSTVNETMGHSVGDQALKQVAERIAVQLEGVARLSRLGSDEFLAVVPFRRGELEPAQVAHQVRQRLEAPLSVMPYSLYFTCSIGVSIYPDYAEDAEALLHTASLALNAAKQSGRNHVRVFDTSDAKRLRDRIRMAVQLRTALEEGQMHVFYQPQVNAQDGRLIGLEALLHWKTPDLGMLHSRRFIGVAEELGLVVKLGRWVQDHVCAQLAKWIKAGYDDIFVAINVSIQQLLRPTFALELRQSLVEHGVPAKMLELEIGDTIAVGHSRELFETLDELRGMGVRIALDDFGTGNASLGHLSRLPADKLKISRELIADISTEGSDAAIARAIQAMGQQLKLKVLAHGVENTAQLGFLRRNHFDQFQGYLFGRAVDADQTSRLLRQRYLLPEAFGTGGSYDPVLLLVDDEENVLRALTRLFRRDGYKILSTTRVDEAFELLAQHPVQVIVSDQRMPGISGTEFLGRVKELYPETIRMILSGYTDLATVTQSINRGAIYRFLTKPWDDHDLREHIRGAFRTYAHQQRRMEGR